MFPLEIISGNAVPNPQTLYKFLRALWLRAPGMGFCLLGCTQCWWPPFQLSRNISDKSGVKTEWKSAAFAIFSYFFISLSKCSFKHHYSYYFPVGLYSMSSFSVKEKKIFTHRPCNKIFLFPSVLLPFSLYSKYAGKSNHLLTSWVLTHSQWSDTLPNTVFSVRFR